MHIMPCRIASLLRPIYTVHPVSQHCLNRVNAKGLLYIKIAMAVDNHHLAVVETKTPLLREVKIHLVSYVCSYVHTGKTSTIQSLYAKLSSCASISIYI